MIQKLEVHLKLDKKIAIFYKVLEVHFKMIIFSEVK
jgi:hypothetical protein